MKWAIQVTSLSRARTIDKWGEACLELCLDFSPVWVRPFVNDLDSACDFDLNQKDVIFLGSCKLVKMVHESSRTFNPGVFYNDKFNYEIFVEENGGLMLNHDYQILKLSDVKNKLTENDIFIRPVLDLKSFCGGLLNINSYEDWYIGLGMGGIDDSNASSIEVLISTPKEIVAEYRCFVIDNQVIDATRYRDKGVLKYERITSEETQYLKNFVKNIKTPAEVCVVDIALKQDDLRIIEFNCFNCSGLYKNDCLKIISEINKKLQKTS